MILLNILVCRRKRHLGVKYVVTNLMRLGWQTLCERQDNKRMKHGRGLNSMMPNGQITDRGINTPSPRESNHSIGELFIRMQVCRPHEAVMSRRVIFCVIVVQIGYAWLPVDKELSAAGAVAYPVKVHVNGFGALLFDGVICKSDSG